MEALTREYYLIPIPAQKLSVFVDDGQMTTAFQQITKFTLWLTGLHPLFSYLSYAITFSSVSIEKNYHF